MSDNYYSQYQKPSRTGGGVRTFFIWFFGLVASAIVGGLIGDRLGGYGDGFWGALASMAAFGCLRLWLAPRKQ